MLDRSLPAMQYHASIFEVEAEGVEQVGMETLHL
jgi:hypothetical protein